MAATTNVSKLGIKHFATGQPLLSMALVALAIIHPILIEWHANRRILEIAMSIVLISALMSAIRWMRILIAICVCFRVLDFSPPEMLLPIVRFMADFFTLVTLASLFCLSVKWALLDTSLALHRFCGALNGYLLLGVFFCKVVLIIHSFNPDCLLATAGNLAERLHDPLLCQDVICYYSFVTLTTIGYGDIVPNMPLTRTLAWIEPMLGQFYLGVIVAGLVNTLGLAPAQFLNASMKPASEKLDGDGHYRP